MQAGLCQALGYVGSSAGRGPDLLLTEAKADVVGSCGWALGCALSPSAAAPIASSIVITIPADLPRRTGLPTGIWRVRMHLGTAGWAYSTFTNSLPKFLPWSRPSRARAGVA